MKSRHPVIEFLSEYWWLLLAVVGFTGMILNIILNISFPFYIQIILLIVSIAAMIGWLLFRRKQS